MYFFQFVLSVRPNGSSNSQTLNFKCLIYCMQGQNDWPLCMKTVFDDHHVNLQDTMRTLYTIVHYTQYYSILHDALSDGIVYNVPNCTMQCTRCTMHYCFGEASFCDAIDHQYRADGLSKPYFDAYKALWLGFFNQKLDEAVRGILLVLDTTCDITVE